MPNESLNSFLHDLAPKIGLEHARRFLYPLSAFLAHESTNPLILPIIARGLTQEGVRLALNNLLSNDATLSKYCKDSDQLAKTLDILFFRNLSDFAYPEAPEGLGFGGDPIENGLSKLHHELYETGDFIKIAYFHLFNFFHGGTLSLTPPYPGWRVVQLESTSIAPLLGETTLFSFLSPSHTGTVFLVCEDTEGFDRENLGDWLTRQWKAASAYRQALQYSIDGIIDIDYVVPRFSPNWLDEVHRPGLYYWGAPRQDHVPFNLRRVITPINQEEINKAWQASVLYRDRILSKGKTLRKAIRIAGRFYEDSHQKSSIAEQFSNLIIALEALYTTGGLSEQTYRISQNCAIMIGEDASERQSVFDFLKEMFSRRGKLFHGQYDPEEPTGLVSDVESSRLLSIVRRSILRFLTLYIKGEKNLEDVRQLLQKAIFDEGARQDLMQRANPTDVIERRVV